MYKYTVTGLEEREANEAAAARGAETPEAIAASRMAGEQSTSERDPGQCKYYLKGIVVHSGTAFAGHYYSYIKVSILLPSVFPSDIPLIPQSLLVLLKVTMRKMQTGELQLELRICARRASKIVSKLAKAWIGTARMQRDDDSCTGACRERTPPSKCWPVVLL